MMWYYARQDRQGALVGGRPLGPVSVEALRQLVERGVIAADDFAWHEGLPAWCRVGEALAGGASVGTQPGGTSTVTGTGPLPPIPPAPTRPAAGSLGTISPEPFSSHSAQPRLSSASHGRGQTYGLEQSRSATGGGNAAAVTGEPTLVIGNVWRRAAAIWVDVAILVVVFSIAPGRYQEIGPREAVISWLYSALFTSIKGGTPGKLLLGLRVVSEVDGRRIGFARATGRYLASYLSFFTFCIGYLIAAFSPRSKALHDYLAGTVVVTKISGSTSVGVGRDPAGVQGWPAGRA